MRSLAAIALCLGLFAGAQALDLSQGVLLKGLTADEDMFKDGNATALRGHRHWHHRHGPPHDPHDGPYWERRHSAKSELLHCLKLAHDDCDMDNGLSLRTAGTRIAQCFLDHLGGCHDIPGIGGDITNTIPWIMAVNGFDALIDAGKTGLLHAGLVFEFYVAGGVPTVGGQANPWYIQGGCSARLMALLTTGCHSADMKRIWALAEVVAKFIEKAYSGTDPNFGLGACAPDIPAVMASLLSSSCPSHGYLYNPLVLPPGATGSVIPCVPDTVNTFEKSAPALLGGSVYSLLLLSGNAKLQGIAIQVAFAGLRMALAATTTEFFNNCLDESLPLPTVDANGLYTGQLYNALQQVPRFSGKLTGFQAATPLQLGPDGTRVICATIAMMSGNPLGPNYGGWQKNLLWQGAADITNALYSTIATHPGLLTPAQVAGLCAATRDIYTFSTVALPATTPPADPAVVAVPGPVGPNEASWSCSTTQAACGAPPASWLSSWSKPELAINHDFGTGSPFAAVCGPVLSG